jgi:MFS family permease
VETDDGTPGSEIDSSSSETVVSELLASVRGFTRSFRTPSLAKALVALIAFGMAEWGAYIALIVYAFAEGGTARIGLVSTITLVTAAVVAPLGSVLGDRYRRERVLILAHGGLALGTGTTAIAMLAGFPPIVVYTAATASAALLTLVRPTHNAVLPALAPSPSDLTAAYAATGVIESTCAFLGPMLATIVFAVSGSLSGPGSVDAALAILLVLGTALVATISVAERMEPETPSNDPSPALGRELSDGVRTAWHDPRPRLLVGLLGMWTFVLGVIDVLIVVLAFEVLGTGESGVGLMNVSIGIGSIVGASAAVVVTGRHRLSGSFRSGLVITGIPVAATAIVPVAAAPMFAFSAAGMSLSNVAGITMLQRLIPDAKLTRVLGVLESMYMAGEGLGAFAASVAVIAVGPRWTLLAGGMLLPVITLAIRRRLARLDVGVRVPNQEMAVLRRTRIFSVLTGLALERLARNAVPVHVQAGTMVIREGDPGDRYYAVASGSVEVSRAGAHVATLGPGDEFGEIALLRDVPRTATVVASTDSRLLSLHRDEFLAALTGEAHAAAHDTARGRLDGPGFQG